MFRPFLALFLSFALLAACAEHDRFSAATGKGAAAVIGGKEIDEDDSLTLSVVALRDRESRDNVCSGTLLSRRIVLTAAHCVEDYLEKNENLEIVLGKSSWEVDHGETFTAEKIIVQPLYLEKARRAESARTTKKCASGGCDIKALAKIDQGDLALIRLNAEVPERMVPVLLNKKTRSYADGATALAVGFGQHSLEDSIDTGFMRSFQAPISHHWRKVDLTVFKKLAVPSTRSTGACFGDSGGPAFVQIRGQRIQAGVAQGALEVDSAGKFACGFKALAYTDVAAYLEWILRAQGELEKLPTASTPTPLPPPVPTPLSTL